MPDVDYERVNEIVDNSLKLYPDMDRYVLWILACDYYLKEELKHEFEENDEEVQEMYGRCKKELKTRTYNCVQMTSCDDLSENIV